VNTVSEYFSQQQVPLISGTSFGKDETTKYEVTMYCTVVQ
jgi:hypothetical protein